MTTPPGEWLKTGMGRSTQDSIVVGGFDLASEIMGKMSFAELAFLLSSGRTPSVAESRLFNAVLVSLADHGLTPTALAARLTYTGAPESLQGAIAAGLLGAGSVFLGPVEDTARFLGSILADSRSDAEAALRNAAGVAVERTIAERKRVPGLGHPIHKEIDPRTPRLYRLADETNLAGPHLRVLEYVAAAHSEATGKSLPINGAGAAGAVFSDLGFPPSTARGFALLARTAGLIGHLAEEVRNPLGMRLWREIDERASRASGTD